MNCDLTHLRNNLFQFDWLIFKILSVDQVRIVSDLHRTHIILLAEFLLFELFLSARNGCISWRRFPWSLCFLFSGRRASWFGWLLLCLHSRLSLLIFASLFRAPFKDCINFLLNPLLVIFSASLTLVFFICNPDINIHMKTIPEYIVQQIHDFFFSSFGNNRIKKLQTDDISLFIVHFCLWKHVCSKDTDFFQFKNQTLLVLFHHRFRCIKLRQLILFKNLKFYRRCSKELLFDPLLHLPYFLLWDQMMAL